MVARLLGVSDVAVLKWIRAEAKVLPEPNVSRIGLEGETFITDDWEGYRRKLG